MNRNSQTDPRQKSFKYLTTISTKKIKIFREIVFFFLIKKYEHICILNLTIRTY